MPVITDDLFNNQFFYFLNDADKIQPIHNSSYLIKENLDYIVYNNTEKIAEPILINLNQLKKIIETIKQLKENITSTTPLHLVLPYEAISELKNMISSNQAYLSKHQNLEQFAKNYIKKINGVYAMKILAARPQKQHGLTCQINALSMAMQWLHQTYQTAKPFPVRKQFYANDDKSNPDRKNQLSLRNIAKKCGSAIGEMYHMEKLREIAQRNGYSHVDIVDATDPKNGEINPNQYLSTLIKAIKNGEAPIVFYNSDIHGDPFHEKSNTCEHAAIIIGYFMHQNENIGLCFFAMQSYVYSWIPAKNLIASTNALSTKREPATYYELPHLAGKWTSFELAKTLEKKYADSPNLFFKEATHPRQAPLQGIPQNEDEAARNKILIVRKN